MSYACMHILMLHNAAYARRLRSRLWISGQKVLADGIAGLILNSEI